MFKNKKFKNLLCITLICAMLVMSMGAYSGEVQYITDGISSVSKYSPIHVMSEHTLESLLFEETENLNEEVTFSHDLILYDSEISDECLGDYVLNIYYGENIKTIELDGIFIRKTLTDLTSGYFALIEEVINIGNNECHLTANINKSLSSDKLFVSFSIVPKNSCDISEYIFFSVGDPFVLLEDINATSYDSMSLSNYSIDTLNNSINWATFSEVGNEGTLYANGSNSPALTTNTYFSSQSKRLVFSASSNAEALISDLQHGGYKAIKPISLDFHLKRLDDGNPYIAGTESIQFNTSSASSAAISFLNYNSGILSTFEAKTASVISAFLSVLSLMIDAGDLVGDNKNNDTNDYALTYDFNTSYFWDFDDEVITGVFQLDGEPGTAEFDRLVAIKYQVQYIPTGSSYPSIYYITASESSIGSIDITLN